MTSPSDDSTAGAVGEIPDPPEPAAPESVPPESVPPERAPSERTPLHDRSFEAGRAVDHVLGVPALLDEPIMGGAPPRPGTARARTAPRGRGPFLVVAAANTIWAAICGYLPVLFVFLAVTAIGTPHVTAGEAARYAAAAWMLAHGVPLSVGGYPLGLAPLAVSALVAWRLGVAGRRAWHASRARPLEVVAVIAVAYALVGVGTAAAVSGGQLAVPVLRAGLTCAAFALVCATVGASAGRQTIRSKIKHVPKPIRDGVRGGLVASALVVASGAAATGVAIAVAGGGAAQILHGYHTGVTGQAGIVLVCLAYAPNVAVWAAAYLAGPGFTLASIPARLPLFAGLPAHPVTGAAQALLLVPVAAGAVAGALALRRRAATPARTGRSRPAPGSGARSAAAAPVAGVVSALVLAAAGRAASGPLGSQLLAHTGEVGWQFPLLAGAGIAVGTLLGVAAYAVFARR